MTDYAFSFINENPELLTEKYANSDVNEAKRIGNLHFNGHKPWKYLLIPHDKITTITSFDAYTNNFIVE